MENRIKNFLFCEITNNGDKKANLERYGIYCTIDEINFLMSTVFCKISLADGLPVNKNVKISVHISLKCKYKINDLYLTGISFFKFSNEKTRPM